MLSKAERARSFTDPVQFQHIHLRRRLWEKQKAIARAVYSNPLVAVKGCHASGKTFLASGLPLSWLVAHRQSKGFVTAPTERQVKMFFEEISLARRQSPLCSQILPECTTMGLKVNEERYIIGASSSRGVNVQGLHSKKVLIIADEAPGIGVDIWEAIEGIRSGGDVSLLKLGNPVVPSGNFFDAFNNERKIHTCFSISAFDTPNFQTPDGARPITIEELMTMGEEDLDFLPYPALIRRRWVKERYIAWGPNHPSYRSRVLAEFPDDDPYSVFPLAWINRAKRPPEEGELREAARIGRVQIGIDVAGPGKDETVATARIGGIVLEQQAWPDPDPRGPVTAFLHRYANHPKYPLGVIVCDIEGIGYNFALHIADCGYRGKVFGFRAGSRPIDTRQFTNAKAEGYFTLREYLRPDLVSGIVDDETVAQLTTLRYRLTPKGLVEIESKEERNKRGIPGSPDRAESLIMAFVKPQVEQQTVVLGGPGSYEISSI